ncbi:MAG: hypothetical protein D6679_02640 [Candidatus Hydrogenedentota bacterium]|nr:MAG: hypothetical protein D6679_02640 [Candidatus Hydrogenedentota bacterium]
MIGAHKVVFKGNIFSRDASCIIEMRKIRIDLLNVPRGLTLPIEGITIGVFDGLHRGHRALVERLGSLCETGEKGLVTFSEHPKVLLAGESPVRLLEETRRERLLEAWGLTWIVELETTRGLLSLEPEDFTERLFDILTRVRVVVVGENFRFGKERRGEPRHLADPPQRRVETVGVVRENGEIVSASGVRAALLERDFEKVERLLGRSYSVSAEKVGGDGIGKKDLVPTINLVPPPEAVPDGIYVVGTPRGFAVCHLGDRPVFDSKERRFEIHLLDGLDDPGWGMWEVTFLKYLRPVRDFPSVEELRKAIEYDIERAREFCKGRQSEPSRERR